jgi:hypothetical protein
MPCVGVPWCAWNLCRLHDPQQTHGQIGFLSGIRRISPRFAGIRFLWRCLVM